jgi:pimeloyl-ACP methyl ester carboxylesterase
VIAPVVLAATTAFQSAPCALEGAPADFERTQRVECGWVSVPLRPGSDRSIRLWVARIRATGPARRADAVLYINGGPGIATVDSILPGVADSKSVRMLRRDRDVILFDQRGSGRSEQALCPDLAKTLSAIEAEGLSPAAEDDRSRAAFAACRSTLDKGQVDLTAYTTAATVDDVEALRSAFGIAQWNLLSISYGGLVAMHAMRARPATIRSVILNSPYPPNSIAWAEQASTTAAAYQAIDRACAAEPACKARFGALTPKLEETLGRLERTPLRDGKTHITGRQFASALWPLAVQSKTVRFVPLAIARAHSGDSAFIKALVRAYGGGDTFGGYSPAQAFAISCFEGGRTRESFARARRLYPALVPAAPDDSFDKLCATFRPGFADPAFFAPVRSSIPTLIYAGLLDPATPTADAYQATRFLNRATVVEVAGAAHGPMSLDPCLLGIAEAFLKSPQAEPDASCVATRAPQPFAQDGLDELVAPAK